MNIDDPEFIPFLLRAKKNTYAGGDAGQVASSRIASHDLAYCDGPWAYHDTYLGGFSFAGEEAVWKEGVPVWAMNYYGTMTCDSIPEGFGDFLKLALRNVPARAPYRGPAHFEAGRFLYTCRWEGTPVIFRGDETIALDGQEIYKLYFHGGRVK